MGRRRGLSIFLDAVDAARLFARLSEDEECAFLWHAPGARARNAEKLAEMHAIAAARGEEWTQEKTLHELWTSREWQAYRTLGPQGDASYLVWHCPSGPVSRRNHSIRAANFLDVPDPFSGWQAESFSNATDAPFVDDEPRYLLLDILTEARRGRYPVGLSTLQVLGNDWVRATPSFKAFWQRFKRFVDRETVEVHGDGVATGAGAKFRAFPSAAARIRAA